MSVPREHQVKGGISCRCGAGDARVVLTVDAFLLVCLVSVALKNISSASLKN